MNQTYLKIPSLLLACAFLLGMLPQLCSKSRRKQQTPNRKCLPPQQKKRQRQRKRSEAEPFAPLETSPASGWGGLSLQRMFPPIWKQQDASSPQASVTGTVTRSDDINGKYYFWGDAVRTYLFTYADGAAVTAKVGGYVHPLCGWCVAIVY